MTLIYTEHQDAAGFLGVTQAALEAEESAHGLMLGIALRLVEKPLSYGSAPYLATVTSGRVLRAAAVMTPPHRLQLYSREACDLGELQPVVDGLCRGHWAVPGVMAPEPLAEAFASIWNRRTGAVRRTGMKLRVYELRRVVAPPLPPGAPRQAAVEDLDLVRQWARAFNRECFGDRHQEESTAGVEERLGGGRLFLWIDGTPVSMAGRSRPTAHGEAIGPVYTPPQRRGRGYATALVAHLAQRILGEGKEFCTLYADLANPRSNSIYQKIGFTAVADVVEMDLDTGGAA